MLAVAIPETGYRIVYFLHIASVLVAFSAAFVHPELGGLARRLPGDAAGLLNRTLVGASTRMHLPALVLAGLFGSAMIPMSEDIYEFSQTWISLAYLTWFAMLAVWIALILPARRRIAGDPGDVEAQKKVAMFTGILHLLLVVMLVLMIWKPGL